MELMQFNEKIVDKESEGCAHCHFYSKTCPSTKQQNIQCAAVSPGCSDKEIFPIFPNLKELEDE